MKKSLFILGLAILSALTTGTSMAWSLSTNDSPLDYVFQLDRWNEIEDGLIARGFELRYDEAESRRQNGRREIIIPLSPQGYVTIARHDGGGRFGEPTTNDREMSGSFGGELQEYDGSVDVEFKICITYESGGEITRLCLEVL